MFLTRTVTVSPKARLFKCRLLFRQTRLLSTENMIERDVVIVGGGPVGLALASALGSSSLVRKSCSIALIEGSDLNKTKSWVSAPETYSNRVSSLTNTSQLFLKDIGAWDHVEEQRICGMKEIQAWDGVSGARIVFSAEDLGIGNSETDMAWLTENLNLQRGLLRHLEGIPEVQLFEKTKVTSITSNTGTGNTWPLVHLDNNITVRARLLVGADGFNSPVRNYANISSYGWAYDTQAIVATMQHQSRGSFGGPNTTSYQRFLPSGPIAFLPLSATVSSLVWSTRPDVAKALISCDPDVVTSMINAAFRLPVVSVKYLYDKILDAHSQGTPITPSQIRQEIQWREQSHNIDQTSAYSMTVSAGSNLGVPPADSSEIPPLVTSLQAGSVASFPLRYNHAETYLGEGSGSRTVLVGDAAHTIHPLAGQGLNLGLADAECLVRCITSALSAGGDIGSHTTLRPYGQERYLANHILMSTVDKLHKIYSTEIDAIVWARSVGVEALNELDSLKAAMMILAGAQSKNSRVISGARAVEQLASVVKTASAVQSVFGTAAYSMVRNLLDSTRTRINSN